MRTSALLVMFLLARSMLPQMRAPASEYQVKAAFLLNFTKFIEWPPRAFDDAKAPIAICLFGDDPFDGALNQLVEGEVVNGRKLVVQKIRHAPAAKTCQVVFVNKAEKEPSKILGGLGPGVLTVGEGEGFLRDGGMIAFVLENHRVRFDINQGAASNAELSLSSRLLSVAKTVAK
uniref:Putative transmembrane protein n=1 Tax=Solibacter usitatus (strain Ellin6076) TaxID=234267 RepID=Q028L6_SOLUE